MCKQSGMIRKEGGSFFNMKVDEKEIWVINLNGPNQDLSILMVGDYNTVLSTSIDCKGNHTTNFHHRALKEITNIMDTLEIVYI